MSKYLDIQGLKTYTKKLKAYIDSKVSGVDSSLFEPVASLPADISAISTNKIYLVALDTKGDQNKYAEYIYTGKTDAAYSADNWEKLGEYNAGSAADVEKDVLVFDSIVSDSITVSTPGLIQAQGSVAYASALNTFVWKDKAGSTYYNSWSGSANYGTAGSGGVTPVKGKIYICGDKVYVYNGTSLVQVGGGNSGSSDEGSVAEIDIADIDLSGSIDDYVKGNKPSRLRVVKGSGDTKKVVGTLDITSDANGSTITEVFTTCYSAVPGSTEIFKDIKDLTAGGFTPGKVSTFNRCYNISASSLTTPASGAWSDWKRGTDYWTRYVLDLMVDSLPEALGEDEITNAVSGILG